MPTPRRQPTLQPRVLCPSANAVQPLTVAVGKADLATVEVNGAPFDVQAVARSNVARFEVK